MAQDPYAAYGGSVATTAPPTSGGDPYAAYGGRMASAAAPTQPSHPNPALAGGTLSAYTPGVFERMRNVVANSAIGHAVEQELPYVADKLNLHPSETVNSPTYQQDKTELAPLQYLAGSPTTGIGHVAKGVLQGVGQLTSGQNLATGAAIAATGGLAAPLAAGAGGAAAAARVGSLAARTGMAALGAHGVYKDAKHAVQQYQAGDTSGALESAGAALPNAALTLPAMGEPLQAIGERMQDGGIHVINKTVGARKNDFARGADPGTGYFQSGLGPSLSMQSIADKADTALGSTGQQIGDTSRNFQASGGLIPFEQGLKAIQAPIAKTRAALSGPGGTGSTAALDSYADTWNPMIQAAQQRGGFLPSEFAQAKRNTASNTTWGDATQAGMKDLRQQTVGGMGGALVDAMPELRPLNSQYQNLMKLAPLAQYRAETGQMPLTAIARKGLAGLVGSGAGALTHNPLLSVATGLGSMAFDSVPVRTAAASALYYGGKGLTRIGSGLERLTAPSFLGGTEGQGVSDYTDDGDASTHQKTPQYGAQSNPLSAPYSMQGLTPEIVRPDLQSRSKFGLGQNGMGGTLIRPLGMLPAPAEPLQRIEYSAPYSMQNLGPEYTNPGMQPQSRLGLGANGRGGTLNRPLGLLPAQAGTAPADLAPPGSVRPLYAAAQKLTQGYQQSRTGALAAGQAISGVDGAQTSLLTPNGSLPGRYRVVEGRDLTASHDPFTFAPNPDYPDGVQERDYAGQRENRARVLANTQNYRPELTITDNPDGANGPPVVTPSGIVLGGNSRVMSLMRLYDRDPSAYRDMLTSKAPGLGIDPEQVASMRKPILVREVNPDGGTEGMRRLGSDLNRTLMGSMGGSEKAVSLGKSISPDTLGAVQSQMDDAGANSLRELLSDPTRSNDFLRRLQSDGVITAQERPQFVDSSTGGMTEEGKRLFERALLGSAIGDSSVMDAAPKGILSKLTASIGPLASLASRGDEWNILPELQSAIQAHSRASSSGMSIGQLLNQRSLGSDSLSPAAEQLAQVLAQNPAAVRSAFAEYAKDARQSPEGQVTFLGPTPKESFAHAFGSAGKGVKR